MTAKYKRKIGVCHFTSEEVEVRGVISGYSIIYQSQVWMRKINTEEGPWCLKLTLGLSIEAVYDLYISSRLAHNKICLTLWSKKLCHPECKL